MNHNQSPSPDQIIKNTQKYVDTRTELQKLWSFISGFETALSLNVCFCILAILKPHLFYISFIVITTTTLRCTLTKKNKVLPVKLPIELKDKFIDKNAPHPGRRKFKKALGTVMLGNSRQDGKEFWQAGEDLLTHGLVIGTTGSGKTELLVSLVGATTFCMAGGVFYLDPKGGNKLMMQFVLLCKLFGRIDDLRILNYKKGGVSIKEEYWQKSSNTFNPFALGNAAENFQILGMLIPSEAGANESFLASAREVMKAILPALCELRDNNVIRLTPGLIADYLNLQRMADLYYEEHKNIYVPDSDENATFTLSNRVKRPLEMYLNNIQYDREKKALQQPESVQKSFGYAKSYYGEPLANLAANFGYIYDFDSPEISLEDTIFNNRILLSLLPAMENAPSEQKNFGKISLSAVKQAMSLGLGGTTEGSYADIIENLPVDMKVPFLIVADEYAEVAVPGFAVAATQGRSLGCSVLFGAQDLAGLVRADKDEAEMIFGNTLNKWLMRTQDPDTTWKKFKELASTVSIAEAGSFGEAGFVDRFRKETSATIKEVDKIHFDDVASQMPGEAHFFERGNVHKINAFYHNINEEKNKTYHRYNRLISILPPRDSETKVINSYIESAENLLDLLKREKIYPDIPKLNESSAWYENTKPFSLFKDSIINFGSADDKPITLEPSIPTKQADEKKSIDNGNNTGHVEKGITITSTNSSKIGADINALNDGIYNANEKNKTTEKSVINEVAKELKSSHNHWLFSQVDSDSTMADRLSERLKEINKAIYGDKAPQEAEGEIKKAVNSISEGTPYTSKPQVERKENDDMFMWDSINELFLSK